MAYIQLASTPMRKTGSGRVQRMALLFYVWIWSVHHISGDHNHDNDDGFFSVDCGRTSEDQFLDSISLPWISDAVSTTKINKMTLGEVSSLELEAPFAPPMDNFEAMITYRYFPESESNKYCYEAHVEPESTILIRVGFLLGSSNDILELPIEFDVSINTNTVFTVKLEVDSPEKDQPIFHEIIWRTEAASEHVRMPVCLIPLRGKAFISSLEFRMFIKPVYSGPLVDMKSTTEKVYMRKILRYNCGANIESPNVRYNEDPYDRIWSASVSPKSNMAYKNFPDAPGSVDPNLSDQHITEGENSNEPPNGVMKDACWDPSFVNISTTESVESFYACLYFQEVEKDLLANGTLRGALIKDPNGFRNRAESTVPVNEEITITNQTTQFCYRGKGTLRASVGSAGPNLFPPILNAIEVYEVVSVNETVCAEAEAVDAIKVRFGLESWKGDPCFPVAYNWVKCENTNIVEMNLSDLSVDDRGEIRSFPNEIGVLFSLRKLYIENSHVKGKIPEEWSGLIKLEVLKLNDNQITGELPSFLVDLPLKELNVDNNQLEGAVPAALSRKLGKSLSFQNNTGLCLEGPNCLLSDSQKTSAKTSTPVWVFAAAAVGGVLLIMIGTLFLCCFCPACYIYKRRKGNKRSKQVNAKTEQHYAVNYASEPDRGGDYAQKLEKEFWTAGIEQSVGALQTPISKGSPLHKDPSAVSKQSSLHISPSESASQAGVSRRASHEMRATPLPNLASSPRSSLGKGRGVAFASRAESPDSSRSKGDGIASVLTKVSRSSRGQKTQAVVFSLQEILYITRNYESQIGEGPTGPVYHGMLSNGEDVAVKIHEDRTLQQSDFVKKAKALAKIRHRNLVPFLGYCDENNSRIVITQFLSNGTLQSKLQGGIGETKTLNWESRVNILLNAAQGLEYLHTDCDPPTAHGNMKSSNIFLDDTLLAQIGDYGMTPYVKSTPGYVDPSTDYSDISKRLKLENDVFAFGIVLLETITGQDPTSVTKMPDGSERSLVASFRIAMKIGNLEDIVDPALGQSEMLNMESIWALAGIAFSCLEPRVDNRPQMTRVINQVRKAFDVL